MLETIGIIFGLIVGAFVLIFGGRGMIDLARERRERKKQTFDSTTTLIDHTETVSTIKEPIVTGPLTEATTIGSQPLVGREKEVSFLKQRVDEAIKGKGSVVFLTGQAGIGKTRLAREVQIYAQRRGCQWLEGKYEKAVSQPYKAWTDIVRNYIGQDETRPLQSLVGPYASHLAKIVPEMGGVLGVASGTEQGDPHSERRQLFEGLTQFFVQVSRQAPLVLFLDDLQWAASLELLHHLARSIGNQRVLTLATYREDDLKENASLWGGVLEMNRERLFHSLPLKALDEGEIGHLISSAIEGSVAPQLLEAIYRRTGGNPFFVEEVVRFLREREAIVQTETGWDVRESTSLETPDSVKMVITERLEQLGQDAGEGLRMASLVGGEFSLRLLRELVEQGEETLIEVMDRCEKAGLVARKRSPGDEVYSFTHDLMQEALYESIGSARRSRLHLRVGQAIEKLYATGLEQRCDALAHHFLEGNDLEKTVAYSRQAGRKAAAQSAYGKAVAYFEQALGALGHLHESREALEQAIAIRIDLGSALMIIKSTSAPEVEETYTQARELCQRIGDTPQLFPVLWGLCRVYHSRGQLTKARDLGEQLLSVAQSMQDPALILEAHHTQWSTLINLGELLSAKEHLERGRTLYDPQQHRWLALVYGGHDPGVCCGVIAARSLWLLGYPDQALQRSQEALSLGRELSHPFSLAFALSWAALVHELRGEREAVSEQAEAAMILATEQGFPRWVMLGAILRGWVSIKQGFLEQGIGQIRQGLAGEMAQAEKQLSVAFLAEAYGKAGQLEEGLGVVAEALAKARKTGLCYYEAELHRIKGGLLLLQEDKNQKAKGNNEKVSKAEACFHQAVDVARRQSARSLELRAVMSLGRLWQKQGKKEEARQMLAEIYGWFTEGFDTADLKEAKALLEELS